MTITPLKINKERPHDCDLEARYKVNEIIAALNSREEKGGKETWTCGRCGGVGYERAYMLNHICGGEVPKEPTVKGKCECCKTAEANGASPCPHHCHSPLPDQREELEEVIDQTIPNKFSYKAVEKLASAILSKWNLTPKKGEIK